VLALQNFLLVVLSVLFFDAGIFLFNGYFNAMNVYINITLISCTFQFDFNAVTSKKYYATAEILL
jgi:uncharacterized membrane protein YqaE (UPF0057 family)